MSHAHSVQLNTGEFGTIRSYPAGTQLFGQDDRVADVYLLQRGIIKLTWTSAEGAESIVGLRWPGAFLGASSLIAALPSPTTAITLAESVIEQITGDRFARLVRTDERLAEQLRREHSLEIVEQMLALGELACEPARGRLKSALQRLARAASGQIRLPDGRMRLPLKKKELAALVAITPEHLSRTLDEMASDGDLIIRGEWIILPDPPQVRP